MKKLLKILFSLYMIFLSFNIYAIQNCDYPWQTYSYSVKHKDSNKKKCGNYAKYNGDGSLKYHNYYHDIKERNKFINYYNDNREILKLKNPVKYVIDNMKINNTIKNKLNNNYDYKQYLLEKNDIDNKIFINQSLFLHNILNNK